MVRSPLLLLAGCAALAAPAAQAQSFDPRRCSAIRDVEVPYEITRQGADVVFTRGQERITVSPQAVTVGSARLDDAALARGYAASVNSFMASSSRFPLVGARFGRAAATRNTGENKGFLSTITQMCQSLLEVHAAQARIKQAFPAFTAPIQVTLAN